jgi:hypothetical protein
VNPAPTAALLGVGALASLVILRRRWHPPIAWSIAIALAFQAVVVVVAQKWTPQDVAVRFLDAGILVLHRHDPLTALPKQWWNFTPFMPLVFAAEHLLRGPWLITGKIAPVLASTATVPMVAAASRPGTAVNERRLRALLWAVSPLSLAVSAVHGQVEPVAVALGLGALLLAERGRGGRAGLVLGAAIAAKSWPVLFIPGVLRELPGWRQRTVTLVSSAAVPVAMIALIPTLLRDRLGPALRVMFGYHSLFGNWGWTGMLAWTGKAGFGPTGAHAEHYQRIGTVVLVVALAAALVVWRRLEGLDLTAALLLVFLIVTAGFGVQYLLWPAALLYARGAGRQFLFLGAAAGFAAVEYLVAIPGSMHTILFVGGPLSLPVIALAIVALPWDRLTTRRPSRPSCVPAPPSGGSR